MTGEPREDADDAGEQAEPAQIGGNCPRPAEPTASVPAWPATRPQTCDGDAVIGLTVY